MYKPVLDAVGGSLLLTALVAMLPLITLFVMLGALRITAWKAAIASLVVAILVAVIGYSMPIGQALLAGSEGAAFGFFPILWIVINAIWVYNMTVVTGHFDVLRRSFAKVSDDQRIQAVIIAFCFGALLEALAGFGTPVAITSVMLIALGFRPLKAAVVALVANTAPVAFGALAVPITTLATVSGLPEHALSQMVGRQTPLLGIFVPMALVYIIDKGKGVRETLPATLTCGFAFAIAQFVTSNFISTQLTDIVAALVGALSVVMLLRVWQPRNGYIETDTDVVVGGATSGATRDASSGRVGSAGTDSTRTGSSGDGDHPVGQGVGTLAELAERDAASHDTRQDVLKAYAPYLIIVVLFVLAQLPGIKDFFNLKAANPSFTWPGLDLQTAAGKPSTIPLFKLNVLSAAGTLMIIAGLITIPVIGISPAKALKAYGATYKQLATAIVTVMAVLGLAYVMNASGETATLGKWLAASGALFAVLSPILGWLGVAVTGSDTSSNSLFGALQVQAAKATGLPELLMAASNSSGGVLGKMISPQNLAIAAAAVGMSGKEGDIFRKVLGWSLGFLAFMCVIVYLQSTPVLGWMIP
ncbi:L-lactate permease [Lapillicoccus sp.]|uniref:L-lactate permease n=1 Tax=Lapillicoccus sp. TaxID=1909287 RepID=UPI003982E9E2